MHKDLPDLHTHTEDLACRSSVHRQKFMCAKFYFHECQVHTWPVKDTKLLHAQKQVLAVGCAYKFYKIKFFSAHVTKLPVWPNVKST